MKYGRVHDVTRLAIKLSKAVKRRSRLFRVEEGGFSVRTDSDEKGLFPKGASTQKRAGKLCTRRSPRRLM